MNVWHSYSIPLKPMCIMPLSALLNMPHHEVWLMKQLGAYGHISAWTTMPMQPSTVALLQQTAMQGATNNSQCKELLAAEVLTWLIEHIIDWLDTE